MLTPFLLCCGFFAITISAKTIDNRLKDVPSVVCGPEFIEINATTESDFEGVIFVKNWRRTEGCFIAYDKVGNATKEPKYSLALKDIANCGLELRRSEDSSSLEVFAVVVFSFHPNFLTMSDRAFAVHCVFRQQEMTVAHKFNFNPEISTRAILESTAAVPLPELTIIAGGRPDPSLSPVGTIYVGDPIMFVWHLRSPSDIYGIRVRDCLAETLDGRKMKVLEDGCSTDDVIVSNVQYAETSNTAFSDAMGFKFPDAEDVWIKCTVELCLRHQQHLVTASAAEEEHFCPREQLCSKRHKRNADELKKATLKYRNDNTHIISRKLRVIEDMLNSTYVGHPLPLTRHAVDNTELTEWAQSRWCMVKNVFSLSVAFVATFHLAIIIVTCLLCHTLRRHQLRSK